MFIALAGKIMEQLPGAGAGFVLGAFCPAVLRKIKSLFVKEAAVVKSDVASAAGKAAASVEKKL